MTDIGGAPNYNLSETKEGLAWLSQFEESDRNTAKLLLDSIIYVSNAQLIKGLNDLITDFQKNIASGPLALFVARENTGEQYWRKTDSRPLSVVGRKPVGSEGVLSNLCRDIAQSNSDILDHPSIKDMKDSHCRFIFCLDDMIGSGKRMASFSKWLHKNKTIKSWHSLHYIEFIACAYAASMGGEKNVLRDGLYSKCLHMQSVGNGNSIWKKANREQIKNLCQNYSKYTSKPIWPLGFQDAFTCIAFAHKCPNDAPAILWASKKDSWSAIFSNRPELMMEDMDAKRKSHQQERILKALGHTRLTRPSFFKKLSEESRQLLILLSCLAARKSHENMLSDILELPLPVIREQIDRCFTYDWIDKGKRLTKSGKTVLCAARRNDCITEMEIEIKNDFYYPKTLRSSVKPSSSGL